MIWVLTPNFRESPQCLCCPTWAILNCPLNFQIQNLLICCFDLYKNLFTEIERRQINFEGLKYSTGVSNIVARKIDPFDILFLFFFKWREEWFICDILSNDWQDLYFILEQLFNFFGYKIPLLPYFVSIFDFFFMQSNNMINKEFS